MWSRAYEWRHLNGDTEALLQRQGFQNGTFIMYFKKPIISQIAEMSLQISQYTWNESPHSPFPPACPQWPFYIQPDLCRGLIVLIDQNILFRFKKNVIMYMESTWTLIWNRIAVLKPTPLRGSWSVRRTRESKLFNPS